MQRNDEPFTAETVDEQIDALEETLHQMPRGRSGPPEVRLIDQLQREFGEDGKDERSIDTVWERLLPLGKPSQPHHQDTLRQEERWRMLPDRAGGSTMSAPTRQRRSMTTRLLTLVAAVVLVTVVGGLAVGLVLVRRSTAVQSPKLSLTIYATVSPPGASDFNSLVALDAQSGREYWQVKAPSFLVYIVQGDGMLYASTVSNMILAYRTSDGSLRWQYQAGGIFEGFQFVQGVLYMNVAGKGLLALGSDGHLHWSAPVRGKVYQVRDGLVYLDNLYVLNASDGSIRLHAQNVTGTLLAIIGQQVYVLETHQNPYFSVLHVLDIHTYSERWHFPQQQSFVMNFIGADQQAIYVTAIEHYGTSDESSDMLYALNANDGSVRWQQPTKEQYIPTGILAQGVVYLGGHSGIAYAFDASTGKPFWQVQGRYNDVLLVADGVICYISLGNLPIFSALNASDGSLRWHYLNVDMVQLLNLGTYLVIDGAATPLIRAFKISDGTTLWSYQPTNGVISDIIAG